MIRFVLPLVLIAATGPAQQPDARQIHWQRTLADAIALAKATHKPLLVAVNMDGESASDRIVHENYRDPVFVAATRACVCVVGSLFRHNARDHDDAGRRIPCPRLGEITCGEHVALEPELFDTYLSDGERVAPRHALVMPDGEKAWDLSLSFDLHDIDRALIDSVRDLVAPPDAIWDHGSWPALAARRDHRGRLAIEDAFARTLDRASIAAGLEALAQHGDAGSRDALRLVAARWPALAPETRGALLDATRALSLEEDVAGALRDVLRSVGAVPGSPDPEGRTLALPGLAALDGGSASTRSLLLASRAIEGHRAAAADAVRLALGAEAAAAVEARVTDRGGAFALDGLLQVAAGTVPAGGFAPLPKTVDAELPPVDALLDRLASLDDRMKADRDDPRLQAEYAIATLQLARQRMTSGSSDVPILLEDAELHFGRALDRQPDHATWWIERARAAYFLQRFELQVEYGRRALAVATGRPVGELPDERTALSPEDEVAVEALRWIGDGDARLLAARSGQDPAVEIDGMVEGMRALGLVAASYFGDEKDWISFASFCGALGLWREELAITLAGALRLPASGDLRQALNAALWNAGRIELAPVLAAQVERAGLPAAETAWFTGYANVLAAEDARRREDFETAIRLYTAAAEGFDRARSENAAYADNCGYWIAMTWLGRGLAHVRAQRRTEAANCLVAAVETGADIQSARDGLGYDVLDLIDKILEWRDSGPGPVRPMALLDRLDAVDPDDPFWAVAVSDSALREALRADGRNPERAMRETVDAAGNPITMRMGLPNDEGDAWLRESIAAGRRAAARAADDEDRRPLAQSDTIWAERMLERDRLDGVREALAEAAALLGLEPPPADADEAGLRALAERLRGLLGEPRPRWREGR